MSTRSAGRCPRRSARRRSTSASRWTSRRSPSRWASVRTYPPHMQHEIWTDGVVLFGEMSALATMRPDGLSLWHVVRFTLKNASPAERNRLSRRLHGMGARPGVLRPPAYPLGRGALFVPADQARAVADVLDEAGAMYDMT